MLDGSFHLLAEVNHFVSRSDLQTPGLVTAVLHPPAPASRCSASEEHFESTPSSHSLHRLTLCSRIDFNAHIINSLVRVSEIFISTAELSPRSQDIQ